ncbi:MAG: type II secretion system F family protein [Candidatus Staskawiczbacteria bacterium]|nr:type II secretion system F family protein [Candidatus Staskawiczbacteria bacterium]
MKYIYQARTKEGKTETGTVEASSKESAALLLQKYNIFVTAIKEQSPSILRTGNISFMNKVSKKDLAIFSRQLAIMLQSRVPVIQSLKGLAIQIKNEGFKEKIIKVSQLVEEGSSLSEAMGSFPDAFDAFYTSLIKTGEASGKISESLSYLSDHLERESDISSQIKNAMIYPAFVIIVMLIVIPIAIVFVIPKIVDLLKETTAKPPPFTLMMINFYGFLADYGWIIFAGLFVLLAFIVYYFTTKEGKKKWDEISLQLPVLRGFLKKTFLIRFAENISTLIGSGLSINNALKITSDTVGNAVYKKILAETERRVSQGEKMSSVLVEYPDYAPPFVVQMIQVGEDTGTLDKNLMEIVNFYNKEVQRSVETFTALLEPVLIVILGGAVAFLAISVIEPLYGALGSI